MKPPVKQTPEPPPRHHWENRPAFRELFLLHAPPLAAEALREAGRHLYDAMLEAELAAPAEAWVRARVRALAEDLRFSGEVLASLGATRLEAELTAEEFTLAVESEAWTDEVMALVRAIERALGGAEGTR